MAEIKELTEIQVFKTVLFHCVLIVVLPVLCFFMSKTFLFDGILGMSTMSSNVYAAGVAVFILHLALGLFIYRTYFDVHIKTQTKKD